MRQYKKLGEILREKGLITQGQLEQALALQRATGERLGKILIDKKWITEDALLDALSERFGIPKVEIDAYTIDPAVVKLVPMAMAQQYKLIPLFRVQNTLTIAMADPLDIYAIDAVRYQTGYQVQEVIASEKDIEAAIKKYYSMVDSMDRVISNLELTQVVELKSDEEEEDFSAEEASDEASIIKLVNMILLQAIRDKASDVHLEPDENVFRIRYRIDGILHEISKPSLALAPMIISRIKIMADLDVSERRIPQDGRLRLRVDGREIDLRVSVLPTVYGEKAVLRILDSRNAIIELEKLGFHPDTLKRWAKVIKRPEGIILITGPTGSGKTTTLYAVLNTINSLDKNIVTVENPVEYKFPLINQVQINPKVGLTFATALRSILRQDPDIIMVGEVRDVETAEIAIRSALTGHLVLSTLHTNDAPSAVHRLIDMGIEPFLVSSSLIAVMAQRLVRKICPNCKVLDEKGMAMLKSGEGTLPRRKKLYRGRGCRECKGTGYSGRTGIHELLIMDETLRRMVVEKAPADEIRNYAHEHGMRTLREDGMEKVFAGITTLDEVIRVSAYHN